MIGYSTDKTAWFDQQTGSVFKKNRNITSNTISSTAITTTMLTRNDWFAEVDSFNLVAGDLEIALDSGQT